MGVCEFWSIFIVTEVNCNSIFNELGSVGLTVMAIVLLILGIISLLKKLRFGKHNSLKNNNVKEAKE